MKNYEEKESEHLTLQEPPMGYDTLSYDDLPEHVKEDICVSLEQIERGEYISFEELMKRLK